MMEENTQVQEIMTLKRHKNRQNHELMKRLCSENGLQKGKNKERDTMSVQVLMAINNLSLVIMCKATRLQREEVQEEENQNLGQIKLLMSVLMILKQEKEPPNRDLMKR